MTLSPFQKRLFIRLGIAAGTIGILGAAVYFLNLHINKQTELIIRQKGVILERARTIELNTGHNSDLKKAEPLLARIQSILPPIDSLVSFDRYLEQAGRNYGVTVGFKIINQHDATAAETAYIDFSLAVSGQVDDIVQFLAFIEKHPYFIRFENLTLTYTKEDQYSMISSGYIYAK